VTAVNGAPTEPALWVLASMALMLLLGALFLTGGFVAELALLRATRTPAATADASSASSPSLSPDGLGADLSAPAPTLARTTSTSGQDALRPTP
jgi:hypothetical protein